MRKLARAAGDLLGASKVTPESIEAEPALDKRSVSPLRIAIAESGVLTARDHTPLPNIRHYRRTLIRSATAARGHRAEDQSETHQARA